MLMEPNCIDLLTIIPKKEIIKFGIPYLKIIIKSIPDFSKSDVKNGANFRLILRGFGVPTTSLLQLRTLMMRKLIDILIFTIVPTMD